MGEVLAHPIAGPIVMQTLAGASGEGAGLMADPSVFKMMASIPIARLAMFPGVDIDMAQLDQLFAAANAAQG